MLDINRSPITFIIILSIIICTTLYGCSVTTNKLLEATTLSSSSVVNGNVVLTRTVHHYSHVFSAFQLFYSPSNNQVIRHTGDYTGNSSKSVGSNADEENEWNVRLLGDAFRNLWWVLVHVPYTLFCVLPIKLVISSLTEVYPGDLCLSVFLIIGCGTHLEVLLSSSQTINGLRGVWYSLLVVVVSVLDLLKRLLFFDNKSEEIDMTLGSDYYSDERHNMDNDEFTAAQRRRLVLLTSAGLDKLYPDKFIQLLVLQFIVGVLCFTCAVAFSLQGPGGIIVPFIKFIDDPIVSGYYKSFTLDKVGVAPSASLVALVFYFTRRLVVCPIFVHSVNNSSNTGSLNETAGATPMGMYAFTICAPNNVINCHSRRLSNNSQIVSRGSRTPSPFVPPTPIGDTTIGNHRPQQRILQRLIQYLNNVKSGSVKSTVVRPHQGTCYTSFVLFNSFGVFEALPGFISTESLLKHVTNDGRIGEGDTTLLGTRDTGLSTGLNPNPIRSLSTNSGIHHITGGSYLHRVLQGVFQATSLSSVIAMDCLALHLVVVTVFRSGSSPVDGAISNLCRVLLPAIIISHMSVLIYRALLMDRHNPIVTGEAKDGEYSPNGQRSCSFVMRSKSRRFRLFKYLCYYLSRCVVLLAYYLRASASLLYRLTVFALCKSHTYTDHATNNNPPSVLRDGLRTALTVECQGYIIGLVDMMYWIEQKCDGIQNIVVLLYDGSMKCGINSSASYSHNQTIYNTVVNHTSNGSDAGPQTTSADTVSPMTNTPTYGTMLRIRAMMSAIVDPPSTNVDNVTITFTRPVRE